MKSNILISVRCIITFFIYITTAQLLSAQSREDTVHTRKEAFPGDVLEIPLPLDDNAVMTDTGFIIRNIVDNLTEIQLSEFAKKKSNNPEIQKIATVLINDHRKILEGYKALANRKKGGLSERQLRNTATLPKLKPLPVEENASFDESWASHMYTMHQAKIHELEQFVAITLDPAIKALAQNSLVIIRTHRNMLAKLPEVKSRIGDHEVIQ